MFISKKTNEGRMQFNTLLFLVGIFSCGHVIRSEEAPYTVEIDNFEISTEYDQKYVNWDTLGLKKKGRNKFVIEGTFSLNRNLGDDQKINIQIFIYNIDKKIKGPLIFNLEKEVCKFAAEDEDIYPGIIEKSNLPEPGTCPIPKKEYSFDGYELKADFLPDDIPRGEYLLVFLLKDGISPVAGFTATITIED